MTLQGGVWRLEEATPPPILSWDDGGIGVSPLVFVDDLEGRQRIGVSGTWRADGEGALRITAAQVFLEGLAGEEAPPRFGGVVDLDAVVRGTRDRPIVTGVVSITQGRIRRVGYERFAGRINYGDGLFEVDVRLDQAPDV